MSWVSGMGRRRRMRRAGVVVAVLLVLVGCGAPAPSSTPSGGVAEPVGLIAIGHSGLTGHGTVDAADAALEYSWATGTKPEVNSIYLRLVKVRPENSGHVANAAIDVVAARRMPRTRCVESPRFQPIGPLYFTVRIGRWSLCPHCRAGVTLR